MRWKRADVSLQEGGGDEVRWMRGSWRVEERGLEERALGVKRDETGWMRERGRVEERGREDRSLGVRRQDVGGLDIS